MNIDMKKIKSMLLLIVVAAIIGGLAIDVMGPTYGFFGKVSTGEVGILTVFGKVQDDVLEEGFHVKNPSLALMDRLSALRAVPSRHRCAEVSCGKAQL